MKVSTLQYWRILMFAKMHARKATETKNEKATLEPRWGDRLAEDPAAALRRQIDGLGRTDRREIPVAGLLGAAEAEGCSQQRDEEEEASHG